jgi:hypothetical protein
LNEKSWYKNGSGVKPSIPKKPRTPVGCFYFHADAKNPYKNAHQEENITSRDIFCSFPEENYPSENKTCHCCEKGRYSKRIHLE